MRQHRGKNMMILTTINCEFMNVLQLGHLAVSVWWVHNLRTNQLLHLCALSWIIYNPFNLITLHKYVRVYRLYDRSMNRNNRRSLKWQDGHLLTCWPFTEQIDGHACGYEAFYSALNTNLNVRHTSRPAFILHTLDGLIHIFLVVPHEKVLSFHNWYSNGTTGVSVHGQRCSIITPVQQPVLLVLYMGTNNLATRPLFSVGTWTLWIFSDSKSDAHFFLKEWHMTLTFWLVHLYKGKKRDSGHCQ